VEELGIKYRDIITIPNPSGCVILPNEVARLKAIILGLARNPNVGAVIFNGLGCESVEAEWFYDQVKDEKPAAFVRAQSLGSCPAALDELEKKALAMKETLEKESRVEVSIADIRLGTKCGASDWTTIAVSNPAIGFASDLVVRNGGISLLGETCGWFGAEENLVRQARNENVSNLIISLMNDIYDRALAVGRRIEEGNPAPGNIAGGITTLNEKALGNVKKGGTAPIEGVLRVGEYPEGKGLFVVDNPGLDPISLLGLACSSANILLYSTGRGTPVGNPIAPAIKLTGSPDAVALFQAHLDIELTKVLTGEMALADAGWILFNEIIEVANGKQTIAEKGRHREFAFPLLMGPL
jgi:altronate dehydratase large subunit